MNSTAAGINDNGDIVGTSLDASFNATAYLRHNGVMLNLNKLIPPNSPLSLWVACSIKSSGEIVGLAMDASTGEFHGFLAAPSGSGGSVEISSTPAQTAVHVDVRRQNLPGLGIRVR